jgi:uncharacterized protein
MPTPQHESDPDEVTRRCILTGLRSDPDDLLRLVQAPDGTVVPDVARRLPGRGAWVSLDRALVSAGVASGKLKGSLARGWKTDANGIGRLDGLIEMIDGLLARRAADRLGLEKRANHIVLGFDSIVYALNKGQVYALLSASDAAADGRNKLANRLDGLELPAVMTRAELSLAFGRENVVHAAVTDPGAASRLAGVLHCLLLWHRPSGGSTPETKRD